MTVLAPAEVYEIVMEPIGALSRINHDSPYSRENLIRKIDGIETIPIQAGLLHRGKRQTFSALVSGFLLRCSQCGPKGNSLVAVLLSGCQFHASFGIGSFITGESYPNAANYQTGAFTYHTDEVTSLEIYWRSGEVEVIESDSAELSARESGGELPEDSAMHYLLEDGTLRIRFCESGAAIQVHPNDKRLTIEVPKGIDLSIHTTSAPIKADTLEKNSILISAHSGRTALGTVNAGSVDLSSSSGSIRADSIVTQTLKCNTSSGSVQIDNNDGGTYQTDT